MVEIVPATQELVAAYLGRPSPHTFKGYAAVRDGQPIGLAGIYREGSHLVAFSEVSGELKDHKRAMVEGRRLVRQMMAEVHRPVFAEVNAQEPGAPKLLARLGFVPLHDNVLVRMPC